MKQKSIEKYLETDRLYLRELTLQDEQIIYELDSDPDVMKYLTDGQPSSRDEVKENLRKTERVLRKHKGKFGMWAAYSKQNNQFLGWFHLKPGKRDPENVKRVELGYRLLKRFWGNGFATEGSIALLEKGFDRLGVEEIFAITMQKNSGSRRVMEKVGMKFIRDFFNPDFPGTKEKDVEYSISKDEWLKKD